MNNLIEMKVRVAHDSIELPTYETKASAGMDLRAYLPEGSITLEPKQRVLIGTGLYFEIPEGFEVQIRSRSGLALKHGVTVLNSPGTIDADYRGEIKVILMNHGDEPFRHRDMKCALPKW
jgi:dUTP pyrophosphatase